MIAPSASNFDATDIELSTGGTWSADVAAGGSPGQLWWAIKGGTVEEPVYTAVTTKAAYDGTANTFNTGDEWATVETFDEKRTWEFALLFEADAEPGVIGELATAERAVTEAPAVAWQSPQNATEGQDYTATAAISDSDSFALRLPP